MSDSSLLAMHYYCLDWLSLFQLRLFIRPLLGFATTFRRSRRACSTEPIFKSVTTLLKYLLM